MSESEVDYDKETKKLEYLKIKQETSWRGYAVPIASATIGLASFIFTIMNWAYSYTKDSQDHVLACVNFAEKMLNVSQQQENIILQLSNERRVVYITSLLGEFTPDAAWYLGQDLLLDGKLDDTGSLNAISYVIGPAGSNKGVNCPSISGPFRYLTQKSQYNNNPISTETGPTNNNKPQPSQTSPLNNSPISN